MSTESGFRTYFSFAPGELLREYSSQVPGLVEILEYLEAQFVDKIFPAPSVLAELSGPEREVLVELASCRTLAEVAPALYLTTNTVSLTCAASIANSALILCTRRISAQLRVG